MGGLSQYLPSHKRLDFSFLFDANLGTLEAFIHKSKKRAANPILRALKWATYEAM